MEFREISHKITMLLKENKNEYGKKIVFDIHNKKISGHQDLSIKSQQLVLDKAKELFKE